MDEVSIFPLDTTEDLAEISIFPLDATENPAEVSMFSLELASSDLNNSALDNNGVGQYRELAMSLTLDPKSIQLNLFRFHDSVRKLAGNYTSMLAEVYMLGVIFVHLLLCRVAVQITSRFLAVIHTCLLHISVFGTNI